MSGAGGGGGEADPAAALRDDNKGLPLDDNAWALLDDALRGGNAGVLPEDAGVAAEVLGEWTAWVECH